ncbi:MAG: tRNA dihydrouridine(20/20a) synthase DusA [Rhodobacteraceae bacterium]|nr:MAG: tRNA dihydrouridine(20/20a) synthase DusA [Paracoccaceae bacterium]
MTCDAHRLCVAPMMDWTDRHCRMLHRALSRRALLYTEMVTAAAVVHGHAERLLAFSPAESPVALQLGGSDPALLAEAVRRAASFGYAEINLNVGCPSDRVQSGAFGACLMRTPALVADCVAAMIAASPVEVTVKCRIGVDEQDPAEALPAFVETVAAAGVRRFVVHARKAWLDGLSPKENREVPPLDHPLVAALKQARPDLVIVANGGLATLDAALDRLAAGLDGAMVGRAAWHDPVGILGAADRRVFGAAGRDRAAEDAVAAMLPYIEAERSRGEPLARMTRPMLGLFAGRPGARRWRRMLSEEAHRPGAGPELVRRALAAVAPQAAAA